MGFLRDFFMEFFKGFVFQDFFMGFFSGTFSWGFFLGFFSWDFKGFFLRNSTFCYFLNVQQYFTILAQKIQICQNWFLGQKLDFWNSVIRINVTVITLQCFLKSIWNCRVALFSLSRKIVLESSSYFSAFLGWLHFVLNLQRKEKCVENILRNTLSANMFLKADLKISLWAFLSSLKNQIKNRKDNWFGNMYQKNGKIGKKRKKMKIVKNVKN